MRGSGFGSTPTGEGHPGRAGALTAGDKDHTDPGHRVMGQSRGLHKPSGTDGLPQSATSSEE